MRDFPFAVEGAGDLREPLLMFGCWLPGAPGEIAGLELFLLKRPIAAAEAWRERAGMGESRRSLLGEKKFVEGATQRRTHKESARSH